MDEHKGIFSVKDPLRSEITNIRAHAHAGMKECVQILNTCAAAEQPLPALLVIIHEPTCSVFADGNLDAHDCDGQWQTFGTKPLAGERHPTLAG